MTSDRFLLLMVATGYGVCGGKDKDLCFHESKEGGAGLPDWLPLD